ncbi:MAG: putative ATP-dependent RNA helicase [Methanocella sp. PtaU1.Bin125]|nr:MAG: putative ATP-dependent RNA helicase [Methanocella sp. PtaU1.Bin125]
MSSFNDLGLSDAILKAIAGMGFEEATHIQEQAIPLALRGQDIIGQAQTGTGKTAAFGIPMVEKLDSQSGEIQGIVITPTRELAIQVAEEINRIGQHRGIRALPIYGGQDYRWQMQGLKNKPQVIVGTPGRLVDHITLRKTIKVDHIRMLVLDEADEMLDMGFIGDIETILSKTPEARQTLLFSATMSPAIRKLALRFMRDPVSVSSASKKMTVALTSQYYIEVNESGKFEALCRILDQQCPEVAIVFGRTKKRVDELQSALMKRGYSAGGLHGDLDQSRRDSVMRQFKEGGIQILVATDVAARGIDVSDVSHVFNFDIPQDTESYVHRIGRTGRRGKTGMAITFVTPRETRLLKIIEQVVGQRMTRMEVPTLDDAIKGQQRLAMDSLLRVAGESDALKYRALAEMLLEERDSVTLLSAALKLLIKEPVTSTVTLTEVKPAKMKNQKHPKARREDKNSYRGRQSDDRGHKVRTSRSASKRG